MSTLENVARAFALFTAGYPSAKRIDEGTVRVWTEALADYPGPAVEQGAKHWIQTETRFPTLAGFIEAIRAQRVPGLPVRETVTCGLCEDGWVEPFPAGRGTVARCPNGCLPTPYDEVRQRPEGPSTASPDVIAMLAETQAAASLRRVEIGDEAYLIERGFDPTKYRMQAGMICANPPDPKLLGISKRHFGTQERPDPDLLSKPVKEAARHEIETGEELPILRLRRQQMAEVAYRWDLDAKAVKAGRRLTTDEAWAIAEAEPDDD